MGFSATATVLTEPKLPSPWPRSTLSELPSKLATTTSRLLSPVTSAAASAIGRSPTPATLGGVTNVPLGVPAKSTAMDCAPYCVISTSSRLSLFQVGEEQRRRLAADAEAGVGVAKPMLGAAPLLVMTISLLVVRTVAATSGLLSPLRSRTRCQPPCRQSRSCLGHKRAVAEPAQHADILTAGVAMTQDDVGAGIAVEIAQRNRRRQSGGAIGLLFWLKSRLLSSTDSVPSPLLATKSSFPPSPFTSAAASAIGLLPTVRTTVGSNFSTVRTYENRSAPLA